MLFLLRSLKKQVRVNRLNHITNETSKEKENKDKLSGRKGLDRDQAKLTMKYSQIVFIDMPLNKRRRTGGYSTQCEYIKRTNTSLCE
jgi:hypothetical protein